MSNKGLHRTLDERGKKRSRSNISNQWPYKSIRNELKIRGPRLIRTDMDSLEDLEDSIRPYKSNALYHSRFSEWAHYVGPIHRLIEKYVGKHISELHTKCMSYGKKSRHRIWHKVKANINELISTEDSVLYEFQRPSSIMPYYISPEGLLLKEIEYEGKSDLEVDIETTPLRGSYRYLNPNTTYYKLVNGKKVYPYVRKYKTFGLYENYCGYINREGWYSLEKEDKNIPHKVLILSDKGCPIFTPEGPLYEERTITNTQYYLVYVWWDSKYREGNKPID